jgi:hypothetical protein
VRYAKTEFYISVDRSLLFYPAAIIKQTIILYKLRLNDILWIEKKTLYQSLHVHLLMAIIKRKLLSDIRKISQVRIKIGLINLKR